MPRKFTAVFLLLLLAVPSAFAGLTENFDDVSLLPGGGWALINRSSPAGTTGWFQGDSGIFPSQAGAGKSYIAANFNNAAFGGNISNWLLTPEVTLTNGDSISFYTRTEKPAFLADRLELRYSTAGASTNVGLTAASIGDFGNLLLTVNPSLSPSGYPDDWTLFSATLSGLGGPATGRYAFRYLVPDTSVNADFIGIDTLSVGPSGVPEPASAGLLVLGIGALALARSRSRSKQISPNREVL
ncbi:MAG: PEP-CTERM sorting domain-containing protein [Bryobacterales bacterium]|nr:PEP-CTERM sorting domain-containing protein [Bryobacterales bacterium]